jgi:hypothetical protein
MCFANNAYQKDGYSEDGNTYTGRQQMDPQQWKLTKTEDARTRAAGYAFSKLGGGLSIGRQRFSGPTYTYQRIQQQAPAPTPAPAAPAPAPRDYGTPIWREAGNALTIN